MEREDIKKAIIHIFQTVYMPKHNAALKRFCTDYSRKIRQQHDLRRTTGLENLQVEPSELDLREATVDAIDDIVSFIVIHQQNGLHQKKIRSDSEK